MSYFHNKVHKISRTIPGWAIQHDFDTIRCLAQTLIRQLNQVVKQLRTGLGIKGAY